MVRRKLEATPPDLWWTTTVIGDGWCSRGRVPLMAWTHKLFEFFILRFIFRSDEEHKHTHEHTPMKKSDFPDLMKIFKYPFHMGLRFAEMGVRFAKIGRTNSMYSDFLELDFQEPISYGCSISRTHLYVSMTDFLFMFSYEVCLCIYMCLENKVRKRWRKRTQTQKLKLKNSHSQIVCVCFMDPIFVFITISEFIMIFDEDNMICVGCDVLMDFKNPDLMCVFS